MREDLQNTFSCKILTIIKAILTLKLFALVIAITNSVFVSSNTIFIMNSHVYAEGSKQRSITGIQHCPGGIVINRKFGNSQFSKKEDRPRIIEYGMGKLVQGRNKRFFCEYPVLPDFVCKNIDKACTFQKADSNTQLCICPHQQDFSTIGF